MSLPVLIGVTGHRNYRKSAEESLRASVREVFSSLQKRCPHTELMLLTGLAEGADTLCAEEALAMGIPITVVLPTAEEVFLEDFDDSGRARYYELSRQAQSVLTASEVEASTGNGSRTHDFRQEGIYLVEHCHVLLALWDGAPPKGGGCGTAEVVDMLRRGNYLPRKGVPLRSVENECLICIDTPREGSDAPAGRITVSGNEGILDETEEFNAQCVNNTRSGYPLYDDPGKTEALLNTMFMQASGLSGKNAAIYRRILRWLAVISTVIAAAFLLYDEAELSWMLLFCGLGLVLAAFCRHWARHSDCHRRYIEYRELAESIRVHAYLRRAGSTLDVKDFFPASLQDSTPWIYAAICAIAIYPVDGASDTVWDDWVAGQYAYHSKAMGKTDASLRKNDRWVELGTVISVVLYCIALVFEFGLTNVSFFTITDTTLLLFRVWLKVLLGSISAGSMFLSHYYGKLSLSRKLSDHQRMERFYGKMEQYRQLTGVNDEWLEALAREELIENSNWCAYQLDNALTIDL